MYRTRVIPCLLLSDQTLVKTIRFSNPTYIGDPVNTVRIFNDLEVDELFILDIDASLKKTSPDFALLEEIASQCFMPLGYGGGIKTVEDCKRLFKIGIEKVAVNTLLLDSPEVVKEAASCFGSQSIVGIIDVKKNWLGKYKVFSRTARNQKEVDRLDVVEYARTIEGLGVGEIILYSVDRDGTFQGYDLELIKQVSEAVSVPVVACGGASSFSDLALPVHQSGASAVAAGSIFIFQNQNRSVLINFPDQSELKELFQES